MGGAAGPTSSSDAAASIQRQDSTNSLASAASSAAVDMASVERESSAGSAAIKGGPAAAILPLVTLEELDLKPFFALAPSAPAAAGLDAPAIGGVGGEIGAGAAAASEGAITTIAQFLSQLKVTAIHQHPLRRHVYVLASTLGTYSVVH